MRSKSLARSPAHASGFVHSIVGDELCAVDVTCRIRDGKDDEIGYLLGRAPARITHTLIARPKRSLARGVLGTELALGKFSFPFGKALRRIDEARYHAVDADVMWRKLVGEHLGEPDLGRFRRSRAGGQKRWVERHDPGLTAHIDDPATALGDHHRHYSLTDAELREEIDRHAVDESLVGHFEKRFVGAGAGIVDQDVDVAELVFDDARNRLDLFDLCHVQRVRFDLRLGALHDVARRIGERRLPPRTDQDLHALPRERACRLKTNSLASTSDQSRLVRKSEFHRLGSFQRSDRLSPSSFLQTFRNFLTPRVGLHHIVHCMASAIFSAAIRVGKLVLAHGTTGKIEASTTRKPCTPLTRPCVSTTAIGSSGRPMRHEHEACHTPIAALRTKASIASSSLMPSSNGNPSTPDVSIM